METVAIVGVGLIGGSFALALRKAGFTGTILGVSSEATLRSALEKGVIDEGLALEAALPRADLVLLAHPILRILDAVSSIDPLLKHGALVTDVGSTKAEIGAQASGHIKRGLFIGGHPMAGKETRGIEHSDEKLFHQCTWFLTPEPAESLNDPRAINFLDWLRRIGAEPVAISAAEHDRLVAFTSHLPQMLSTALAAALNGALGEQARIAAGPGLRDMTRLAMSDYALWSDILTTNSANIGDALEMLHERVIALREQVVKVTRNSDAGLSEEFEMARNFANALRKRRS